MSLAAAVRYVVLAVLVTAFSGCIYSNVKVPLDTDVEATQLGNKVGMASNQSILWLVAWGDGGIEAAAKNGGITVVRHLDVREIFVLFGVYARATTIAYGD